MTERQRLVNERAMVVTKLRILRERMRDFNRSRRHAGKPTLLGEMGEASRRLAEIETLLAQLDAEAA